MTDETVIGIDGGVTLCLACAEALVEGDEYFPDVSGDVLHAQCCGSERESYVKDVGTGEQLGPNDPIPAPQIWTYEKVRK